MIRYAVRSSSLSFLLALVVAGCSDAPMPSEPETVTPDAPSLSVASSSDVQLVASDLNEMNRRLAEMEAEVRVAKAEYVVAEDAYLRSRGARNLIAGDGLHVVFADDRQLRLATRWVPEDPRRGGRLGVEYTTGLLFGSSAGGTGVPIAPAVDASFATWEELTCSGLPIDAGAATLLPSLILTVGLPPELEGPGDADIGTVGFLPGFIFEAVLGEGASEVVLGVTFTFVFVDPDENPTDIDGDGRNDTGFKEVWYNDAFEWTTDPASNPDAIDLETVAFHENGHVLELGHFGKIHATFNQGRGNDRPGTLHVSPRAAMNAAILGTLREPLGSDEAAYCGNFAAWPSP